MMIAKIENFIVPKPGELIVITGPMAAGKTTLIQNLLDRKLIRADQVIGDTMMSHLLAQSTNKGIIYHFNSVVALWESSLPGSLRSTYTAQVQSPDSRSVRYWKDVLCWPGPKRAVVVIVDELTWWRRLSKRPGANLLLQLGQSIDLATHYRLLFSGLRNDGIEFVILDATSENYDVIENIELRLSTVALDKHALTEDDIRMFTKHSGFERGLTESRRRRNMKKRLNRSNPMKDLAEGAGRIVCPDLNGKSVLDTECGWGAFCFIAESRGASHVVGLEAAPDRFAAARAMKRLLGSSVEFVFGDSKSVQAEGKFDVVTRTDGRLIFSAQ